MRYLIPIVFLTLCSCSLIKNEPIDPGVPTTPITKSIPFVCNGDYYVKIADPNMLGTKGYFMMMNNDMIYSLDSNKLTIINCDSFKRVSSHKIGEKKVSRIDGYVSLKNNCFWLLYETDRPNTNYPDYELLSLIDSTGKAIHTFDFESECPNTCEYTISATANNGCLIGCMDLYKKYLLNLDENGNIIWKKEFPIDINYLDHLSTTTRIIELKSKDFLYARIIRYTLDGVSQYITKISKLDKDGNLKWEKQLPSNLNLKIITNLIEQNDSSYLITGNYTNLIKIDSIGNVIWKLDFKDNGYFSIRTIISNDGSIIASYRNPANGGDISISKINNSGQIDWTNSFGGTGFESINYIFNLVSGGFYVIGESNNLSGQWKKCLELREHEWHIYYIEEEINSGYFIKTDNMGNSCK